jgi:hypothetical protein
MVPMTVLNYPVASLPAFIVVSVLATLAIPIFAFAWLVLVSVVALVAVIAVGWVYLMAWRSAGHALWWRWRMRGHPQSATQDLS